jgi:DNA-binding beta-propeller fold protein YncE
MLPCYRRNHLRRDYTGSPIVIGIVVVNDFLQPLSLATVVVWVTNQGAGSVTKLRASDGAVLGTFNVGGGPLGVVFDGANIWVADGPTNTVIKLSASGSVLGNLAVGSYAYGAAFDGAHIWVTNNNSNTVSKL